MKEVKNKKKSRKPVVMISVLILIIFIIGATGSFYAAYKISEDEEESGRSSEQRSSTQQTTKKSSSSSQSKSTQSQQNQEAQVDVLQYIRNSPVIRDIPKNRIILLRFYNFHTGEREWEESFILKKNSVERGFVENADITLVIKSNYISELAKKNLCNVIKSAKANNDLGLWTDLSQTTLLWRFKSMLSQRECFGL